MTGKEKLKAYYLLAKPGIIYGNAVSTVAGFFLASKHHFSPGLFLVTLLGISLVMASGCVFNNYIDKDIDAVMKRTRNRALVKGTISDRNALVYATVLGLVGTALLGLWANWLTAAIALFGLLVYVVFYGITKRRTVYGTLVGAVAGAVPPVVGYCAVTNHLDLAAWLLFAILVVWQMPHFYAIAIYREEDYGSVSIPVLPVKSGIAITKIHMAVYIALFIITTSLLTVFGYTGITYLVVSLVVGVAWFRLALQGFTTPKDVIWARKLFRFSLIVLVVVCAMLSVNTFLP